MKTSKGGFTLFEILLIFALSASITAFGAISLARLQALFQVRSAADEIKSRVQYGRDLAIANKDAQSYSLTLVGSSVKLLSSGQTISQYQVPVGIVMAPTSLTWSFTPTTGAIASCTTCTLDLSFRGVTESIIVQANGLVN